MVHKFRVGQIIWNPGFPYFYLITNMYGRSSWTYDLILGGGLEEDGTRGLDEETTKRFEIYSEAGE